MDTIALWLGWAVMVFGGFALVGVIGSLAINRLLKTLQVFDAVNQWMWANYKGSTWRKWRSPANERTRRAHGGTKA